MVKIEVKKCGFPKGSSVKPCTEECEYYNTCTRNPYRNKKLGGVDDDKGRIIKHS